MNARRRSGLLFLLLLGCILSSQEEGIAQTVPRRLPVRSCSAPPLLMRYAFDDAMTDSVGANAAFVAGSVAPTFGPGRIGKALYFTSGATAQAPLKSPPAAYTTSQWVLQQTKPSPTMTCAIGANDCNLCRGSFDVISAYMISSVTATSEGGGPRAA